MKENKLLLIIIASLLAVILIVAGTILVKVTAQGTSASSGETVNTISVSSEGEVTVLPDVGYISLGIETTDEDVKEAEDENSATMEDILQALKEFDVEDTDIQTVGYYIYPDYDYDDEKPTSYTVYNTIQVTVKNLEDMSGIIDAAIDAGANRTNSISFDVLDREASYNEALEEAIANAYAKAEIMAEAAGLKIVGVLTVSEGSSYSSYYYADTISYAAYDTEESAVSISTGDIDISANVTVTFEVKQK